MELHKALKEIIVQKGVDMINNIQIINFLLDYQAFKEKPAAKPILRDVINSGYGEKICNLNSNAPDCQTKFKQYLHDFIDSFGYKEELTNFVFDSIAYGLGLNLTMENPNKKQRKTVLSGVSHEVLEQQRNEFQKNAEQRPPKELDADGRMKAWLKDREEHKDEIEARRKVLFKHYYGDRPCDDQNKGVQYAQNNKVSREFANRAIKRLYNGQGRIRTAFNQSDLMFDNGEISFLQELGIVQRGNGLIVGAVCVKISDMEEIIRRVEEYFNS